MAETDLSTLVSSLKRALAVPGTFDTYFPDTTNTDLKATLADAFAECQMDGLLSSLEISSGGVVQDELTPAQQAMIVLYANARILTSEIRNRKTHVRYEAPGVVFEQDQAASSLNEQLKMLQAAKQQIRDNLASGARDIFWMVDAYVVRGLDLAGGWNNPAPAIGW